MKAPLLLVSILAVAAYAPVNAQNLFNQATVTRGIPAGGSYVPPGGLYDNEQSDGSTSLASQDSSGTLTARSADDFVLTLAGCPNNQILVTQIRTQMVQADAAPQPFAIDIYNDDGTGNSPAPTNAITPIATAQQTSSALLGAFGVGTSVHEVAFNPTNLVLTSGTRYWISGYGATAASNAAAFNNFFAASAGLASTTDNGVIIAPGAGVANWTPADSVIGPPALAFSFAIDGRCAGEAAPVSANKPWALWSLIGLLALAGVLVVRRQTA